MANKEMILVLDFGSQYNQLIARRIREAGVYSEVCPFDLSIEEIKKKAPLGIILSGGPDSVYEKDAPRLHDELYQLGVPMLAICYGMQLMTYQQGGVVARSPKAEYGRSVFRPDLSSELFHGLPEELNVWMSHGDHVESVPGGFKVIGTSENAPIASYEVADKKWFALQFHPEVTHTQYGHQILNNFVKRICQASGNWNMESFVESSIEEIRQYVGSEKVICGLSGGVDSSVAAVLIHKAIQENLTCVFVDNGLLRKNERGKVEEVFKKSFGINLVTVDATKEFLDALKGVEDPELKRKRIGHTFIDVFDEWSHKLGGDFKFLAQGTLYPDVIESVSAKGGPSVTIKSHHNVGGLPEKMNLKLVEPLKELFKDEVRELGTVMGIPQEIVRRQPFPGPGLAVRILGEVTWERCEVLREADAIVLEEIKNAGLYEKIWQSFAILLPLKTVGVMGDSRTYENVVAIRAVESLDGMTADWVHLPYDLLSKISNRIINEVQGVNRVVYDVSSKPPATIEWE